MKISLLPLVVFLLPLTVEAQKETFVFERPGICCIDTMEVGLGSRLVKRKIIISIPDGYYPSAAEYRHGQPIIYFRTMQRLQPEVYYYFSVPDSTIRLIQYTWNGTATQSKYLSKIYEHNAAELSARMKEVGEQETINHDGWVETKQTWEDANTYVKQTMISGSGTYRVKVLISWK